MKFIRNLSLRTKFLTIIVPMLLGLAYLTYLEARDSLRQTQTLDKLYTAIDASVRISFLVHEIQKERGNSSGYLSNNGEKFGPQLIDQRELTDKRIFELEELLAQDQMSAFVSEHQYLFDQLNTLVDRIPTLRKDVNDLVYTPNEAIDNYTVINTWALDMLGQIIPETDRSDIYGQVQAYINFLKSKERAGIERAIGTQAFSKKFLDNEVYKRFSSLVSEQNAFLNSFRSTASREAIDFYQNTLVGAEVDEVNRMRTILYSNENLEDDPSYWFDMITVKINLLKKVEDYMAEGVQQQSAELAAAATQFFNFVVIATIALATLVLVLLSFILGGILRNIRILSAYTQRIARGRFDTKVNIKANDELGRFGKTMNKMAFSIRKAQAELRKEKDKAEYMFKNIYRTSEVVFENVDQGIFLIDKDLKISKLYSKAIENIFDEKEVAGVDFTTFINPRLVPRDREALQVFTKHLFNAKVKDNVLGRLNPIETVQIFKDSEDVGDVLKSKYIRFGFTRIWEDNAIKDVMVTVVDETNEVLLKKEIEANQEKNKQETEHLLNIMKVDPTALRDYLDRANEMIDDINDQYEHFDGDDYDQLAKYTFNEVHNLKGNATLIELDLLEEKFHDIEESLIKLRGGRIDGGDFIKVLYELQEVQVTIVDLGRMLRKIANIYYKSTDKEEVYTNEKLFNSLEKVTRRLSKSMEKNAGIKIKNDGDILIPENLKMAVNDIIVQLIRNSMVHGIEPPHARRSSGKAEEAFINVALGKTNEGRLKITYKDDGAGIDEEKVFNKAKELGIYSESEKERLNGSYAYELLFADGFSTREKTDTYGGRGQGMSLVKEILDKNNAEFKVSSVSGKSFEIEMTFPLEHELYLNEI